MTKKLITILALVVVLAGIVTWEQVYTDSALNNMIEKIETLEDELVAENLDGSLNIAQNITHIWDENEKIICLFVDFRDIEQIGRQADLVVSHLKNNDFELAKVECNTLQRVVETFRDTVKFDWQNIF